MKISAQFRNFVSFAEAAHQAGQDKQIARVGIGPLLPGKMTLQNMALQGRTIVAASGDKKKFAELDSREKNKVYIVASTLSQETGKAVFDGQFTAFDPRNSSQPIITLSDQEADDREFKLSFAEDGQFVLDFKGTQNLQVITIKHGDGKATTHMMPPGNTVKSDLTFKISADEFERLSGLDFTTFDDNATREHMNNATGVDKLVAIPDTFAEEFRLDTYMLVTDSDIRFDIKDGQITA